MDRHRRHDEREDHANLEDNIHHYCEDRNISLDSTDSLLLLVDDRGLAQDGTTTDRDSIHHERHVDHEAHVHGADHCNSHSVVIHVKGME